MGGFNGYILFGVRGLEECIFRYIKKAQQRLLRHSELDFRYTDGEDTDFAMLCEKLNQALEEMELKRIYIESAFRGMRLGEEIVRRLEARAKIKGYRWCVLETGEPLEAACHIYKKLGYQVIPNYGQYADMPESICMQREI